MLGMEAEMLKGHLDAIVLAALEAGPAHGYAIIETIKQRSAGTFELPEGTVYPALHRLEQAGLEVSELREGRKPGTQVFTVRTGTFGVPTIVIQQDKREA